MIPTADGCDNAEYCYYMGLYAQLLSEHFGENEKAKEIYMLILKLSPEDPLSLGHYAVLLHRRIKSPREAELFYKKAIATVIDDFRLCD